MFESKKNWSLFSINLLIVQHANHSGRVHRLTSEKLEILEFAEQTLECLVHVGLKVRDLILSVLSKWILAGIYTLPLSILIILY